LVLDLVTSFVVAWSTGRSISWPAPGSLVVGLLGGWLVITTWGLFGAVLGYLIRGVALPIGPGLVCVMAVENLIANVLADLVSWLRPVRDLLPAANSGAPIHAITANVDLGQPGDRRHRRGHRYPRHRHPAVLRHVVRGRLDHARSLAGPAMSAPYAHTSPRIGTSFSSHREFGLPRRLRRLMVILHIAVSVGWLGTSLCLLVLGLTARLTKDPVTADVAYRAVAILAGTLDVPVSLASLLTGVVLAIGRPWGLTRRYWILAKIVLTLAAVPLAIFALPASSDRLSPHKPPARPASTYRPPQPRHRAVRGRCHVHRDRGNFGPQTLGPDPPETTRAVGDSALNGDLGREYSIRCRGGHHERGTCGCGPGRGGRPERCGGAGPARMGRHRAGAATGGVRRRRGHQPVAPRRVPWTGSASVSDSGPVGSSAGAAGFGVQTAGGSPAPISPTRSPVATVSPWS
jgi:hypothetical protein